MNAFRELLAALSAANYDRAAQPGKTRKAAAAQKSPRSFFAKSTTCWERSLNLVSTASSPPHTTLDRPGSFARITQTGGLSGPPLRRRSTEIINYIARATNGRLPIIGVGGINDAASAGEKLDAGATLIQVYTGMIYRGPFFALAVARHSATGRGLVGGEVNRISSLVKAMRS